MISRLGLSGKNSIEAYNFQGITRRISAHHTDQNQSVSPFKSTKVKEDSGRLT